MKRITIKLNDGTVDRGPAVDINCSRAGTCVCGFCKGDNQCQFGDCHERMPDPKEYERGTLCLPCSGREWRVTLPGHRPSVRR